MYVLHKLSDRPSRIQSVEGDICQLGVDYVTEFTYSHIKFSYRIECNEMHQNIVFEHMVSLRPTCPLYSCVGQIVNGATRG